MRAELSPNCDGHKDGGDYSRTSCRNSALIRQTGLMTSQGHNEMPAREKTIITVELGHHADTRLEQSQGGNLPSFSSGLDDRNRSYSEPRIAASHVLCD